MPLAPRRAAFGCLGLAVVLLAAGCRFHVGAAAQASPTVSSVASPIPSLTAEPSAHPSSTAPAKLSAHDGTNIAACWDGRCEILIHRAPQRIPLDPRFRLGVFSVAKIGAGSVRFRSVESDGTVTRLNTFDDSRVQFGHLLVDVLAVRGHTAKLVFDAN